LKIDTHAEDGRLLVSMAAALGPPHWEVEEHLHRSPAVLDVFDIVKDQP
jgi:hypothetical protein